MATLAAPGDPPRRPGEALRRRPGGRRRLARHRRRRVLLAPRAVRLRQDDDAADDRRLRAADRRPDPAPRPRRHDATRPTSARSTWSSRATRCSRTSTSATTSRSGCKRRKRRQGRDHAARRRGARARPPRAATRSASRTSCRAASSSASRSPGRSSTGRTCCSSTSRSAPSTSSSASQLQVELKRIQTEVGITFVYVTHDQEEALTMSDRIAVMHARQGRAARDARGALRAAGDAVRGRLHRDDEPAHAARSSARRASVRLLDRATIVRRRATTGSPPGATVEHQRPARGDQPSVPAGRPMGAIRGTRRAGRLPREHVSVPGPHGRRPRLHRPRARRPGYDSRSAAKSPSPGPPTDALVLGGRLAGPQEEARHERPTRRIEPSTSRRR